MSSNAYVSPLSPPSSIATTPSPPPTSATLLGSGSTMWVSPQGLSRGRGGIVEETARGGGNGVLSMLSGPRRSVVWLHLIYEGGCIPFYEEQIEMLMRGVAIGDAIHGAFLRAQQNALIQQDAYITCSRISGFLIDTQLDVESLQAKLGIEFTRLCPYIDVIISSSLSANRDIDLQTFFPMKVFSLSESNNHESTGRLTSHDSQLSPSETNAKSILPASHPDVSATSSFSKKAHPDPLKSQRNSSHQSQEKSSSVQTNNFHSVSEIAQSSGFHASSRHTQEGARVSGTVHLKSSLQKEPSPFLQHSTRASAFSRIERDKKSAVEQKQESENSYDEKIPFDPMFSDLVGHLPSLSELAKFISDEVHAAGGIRTRAELNQASMKRFGEKIHQILALTSAVLDAQNLVDSVTDDISWAEEEVNSSPSNSSKSPQSIRQLLNIYYPNEFRIVGNAGSAHVVSSSNVPRLYVEGLPTEFSNSSVEAIFASAGEILFIHKLPGKTIRAFCVQFVSNEGVVRALTWLDGYELPSGHKLRVRGSPSRTHSSQSGKLDEGSRIPRKKGFVGSVRTSSSHFPSRSHFRKPMATTSSQDPKRFAPKRILSRNGDKTPGSTSSTLESEEHPNNSAVVGSVPMNDGLISAYPSQTGDVDS